MFLGLRLIKVEDKKISEKYCQRVLINLSHAITNLRKVPRLVALDQSGFHILNSIVNSILLSLQYFLEAWVFKSVQVQWWVDSLKTGSYNIIVSTIIAKHRSVQNSVRSLLVTVKKLLASLPWVQPKLGWLGKAWEFSFFYRETFFIVYKADHYQLWIVTEHTKD